MFLDPLHVRKNMGVKLGATKAIGFSLYERAMHAPSRPAVDAIVAGYTEARKQYLGKFEPSEIYNAYSRLEDTIVTSQGAESQMSASLRNHIRSVEPQKMINKVVLTKRSRFLKRQSASHMYKSSTPGHREEDCYFYSTAPMVSGNSFLRGWNCANRSNCEKLHRWSTTASGTFVGCAAKSAGFLRVFVQWQWYSILPWTCSAVQEVWKG